jgi:hypothetical protein
MVNKAFQDIRRIRALIALEEMHQKSLKRGLDRLKRLQIETEIKAARKDRRH